MIVADIPVFVISLPSQTARRAACSERLGSQGVKFTFFDGMSAPILGVTAIHMFTRNVPSGELIPQKSVGIFLSHIALWRAVKLMRDSGLLKAEAVMLCEDDASFDDGWEAALQASLDTIPEDWQLLFLGSSDTGDAIKGQMLGTNTYRAMPLCNHCYIVKASAIDELLAACSEIKAPVDIQLFDRAYGKMYVYAILPRVVHQQGTTLNP